MCCGAGVCGGFGGGDLFVEVVFEGGAGGDGEFRV